jgi:hypothetical protein
VAVLRPCAPTTSSQLYLSPYFAVAPVTPTKVPLVFSGRVSPISSPSLSEGSGSVATHAEGGGAEGNCILELESHAAAVSCKNGVGSACTTENHLGEGSLKRGRSLLCPQPGLRAVAVPGATSVFDSVVLARQPCPFPVKQLPALTRIPNAAWTVAPSPVVQTPEFHANHALFLAFLAKPRYPPPVRATSKSVQVCFVVFDLSFLYFLAGRDW